MSGYLKDLDTAQVNGFFGCGPSEENKGWTGIAMNLVRFAVELDLLPT